MVQVKRPIVDRFHWIIRHNCGGFLDADRYAEMDNKRFESGEATNAFIESVKNSMQYRSWQKLICFLPVRYAIRNYVSGLRDCKLYWEDDEIGVLFEQFSNDMCCQQCDLCALLLDEDALKRATRTSVNLTEVDCNEV